MKLGSQVLRFALVFVLAFEVALQPVLAAPNQMLSSHAQAFVGAVEPSSVWDTTVVDRQPGDLEKLWANALEKTKGQPLTAQISDSEKARNFNLWIERLRENAFAQGSADPNSKYYTNHPLDVFQLLGQKVFVKNEQEVLDQIEEGQPIFRSVDWKKLTLEILNDKGQVISRINPEGKDLRLLVPENNSVDQTRAFSVNTTRNAVPGGKYTFRLSVSGKVIHSFQNNIVGAAVIGNHLVFVEPSRASAKEGIVNLSFIDLDYFDVAVGKTVLPVFRVPLDVGTDVASNVEALRIEYTAQGLQIGDRQVSNEVLALFSTMQQMSYNTMVSLTDPKFYQSTAPLIDEMTSSFNENLDLQAQGMEGQMQRAGVTFDAYEKFKSTVVDEMKLRAQIGPLASGAAKGPRGELVTAKESLEIEAVTALDRIIFENGATANLVDYSKYPSPLALETAKATQMRLDVTRKLGNKIPADVRGYTEKVKKFGQDLVADEAFQQSLQDMNKNLAAQRKLGNRINAFFARLTMPQPLGAPKIQTALGMIAAGVMHRNAYEANGLVQGGMTKEAIARIFADPKVRAGIISLPVLTGLGLMAMHPSATAQLMYQGIEAVRVGRDSFFGWWGNWWEIGTTTWKSSWAFLDINKLTSTYLTGEKLSHLSVGLSALMGSVLLSAGGMHAVVNSILYAKALWKGDWNKAHVEGKGVFKQWIKSFVDYMNNDKREFYGALARAEAKKRGLNIAIKNVDGKEFKGLFQDAAVNDHNLLQKAEDESKDVEIEFDLASGRKVVGVLHARGDAHAGKGMDFDLTMTNGVHMHRVLEITTGEASDLFTDENLEAGIGAVLKFEKGKMQARLQNTNWTPRETEELEQSLASVEKADGKWSKMTAALSRVPLMGRMFQKSDGEIRTWGKAFAHFLIGYSTWTHTTRFFGKIWNPWFLIRNIAFRPRTWLTMLAYPNYFNRTVFGADNRESSHFPTFYNGGRRNILGVGVNLAKRAYTMVVGDEDVKSFLKQLNEFEKEIVPVEQKLHAASMRAAFLKLVSKGATDPKVLAMLKTGAIEDPLDARVDNSGPIKGAVKSLFGSKTDKLDKSLSVYLKAYFTKLFDEAQNEYFRRALGAKAFDGMSPSELKELAVSADVNLRLTEDEAIKLVADVEAKGEVQAYAEQTANDFLSGMWERVKLRHDSKVQTTLTPERNSSLNRFRTAELQMDKPEAMARATRQYLVSFIVDKPMEIFLLFLFSAGVTAGVNQPLHDEMFGPNSMFYLSRYVFWNGYFSSIMIALLADVWMKIQMDARLDQQGGFDEVPEGDDAKKGFLRFYRKNFKAKDNTWWENQKYEMKLSWANMPAYFLTALVTNLAFLGRFDLDAFVTVYKSTLMPTGGLAFKLENAFEKSVNYVVGRIPRKYHVDPRVREFRNREAGKLRVKYNIFYKLYENVLGNLLGNLFVIPTAQGPRAFLRQFYGGFLPTELLVNNVFRPLGDRYGGIVEKAMGACETFLSNNHTDAIKIEKRGK